MKIIHYLLERIQKIYSIYSHRRDYQTLPEKNKTRTGKLEKKSEESQGFKEILEEELKKLK